MWGHFFAMESNSKEMNSEEMQKQKVVRLLDGTLQCIFFLRNLDRSQLEMIPTGREVVGYMEQKEKEGMIHDVSKAYNVQFDQNPIHTV